MSVTDLRSVPGRRPFSDRPSLSGQRSVTDGRPAVAPVPVPVPVPSYPALPDLTSPTPAGLARLATVLATRSDLWRPLLHVDPYNRWFTRIAGGEGWEAWLLTWLPGQKTDLHDHGGSAGAFSVLQGSVEELTPVHLRAGVSRLAGRVLTAGHLRPFGPRHIHQVVAAGDAVSATLHVYGPALTVMNRYVLDARRGPVIVRTERAGADW